MKRNAEYYTYKNAEEFGRAIGLTDLDLAIIRQKKRVIEKLKAARIKQGLSQAALAAKIGSKQPAIARMEAGMVGSVSMDFLLKIAIVLEVPITIRPAA